MAESNVTNKALNELKKLLNEILNKKGREKSNSVQEFENKLNYYWEQDKETFGKSNSDVLCELLNDLACYQPNTVIRLTDKSLLDDIKLDDLIKKALKELK